MSKTFGQPDVPSMGIVSTGEYNFEDNNLDCYKLYDFQQTDMYHGLNREDDYYTSPKNLRKPFHKRKKPRPTVEEFWKSDEPIDWKMKADDYADVRRFKRWIRAQLRAGIVAEKSFEDSILEKYGDKIDICLGDWDQKGEINRDIAVHKLDCS